MISVDSWPERGRVWRTFHPRRKIRIAVKTSDLFRAVVDTAGCVRKWITVCVGGSISSRWPCQQVSNCSLRISQISRESTHLTLKLSQWKGHFLEISIQINPAVVTNGRLRSPARDPTVSPPDSGCSVQHRITRMYGATTHYRSTSVLRSFGASHTTHLPRPERRIRDGIRNLYFWFFLFKDSFSSIFGLSSRLMVGGIDLFLFWGAYIMFDHRPVHADGSLIDSPIRASATAVRGI